MSRPVPEWLPLGRVEDDTIGPLKTGKEAEVFVDDAIYHEGRRFRRSRDQRAVAKMTDRGKRLLNDRWIGHEHDTMRQLWGAGASVPYPVELVEDGMLMELVGDHTQAAPRLATARLDAADLSPYNILWWQGQISIIDLPQAAELFHNPNGFNLLHRDVVRMCEWFGRKGQGCDADEVFASVLP